MLDATTAIGAVDDAERAGSRARCMRMLSCASGIQKSEFKSPAPPHELRFSADADLDISCFVRGALASIGAVAPSIASSGLAGTALHVHVNVRNPQAGGRLLSACQLVDVVLAWVRFDIVLMAFARPWLWCEPSCTPLFATGAERTLQDGLPRAGEAAGEAARSFEAARAQALDEAAELARRIASLRAGHSCAPPPAPPLAMLTVEERSWRSYEREGSDQRVLYDVPSFVEAAHAIVHADGFTELSEADQVEALFGDAGPGVRLGRYCSLNLGAIAKFGTLEVCSSLLAPSLLSPSLVR
jgi:hypothetical protein